MIYLAILILIISPNIDVISCSNHTKIGFFEHEQLLKNLHSEIYLEILIRRLKNEEKAHRIFKTLAKEALRQIWSRISDQYVIDNYINDKKNEIFCGSHLWLCEKLCEPKRISLKKAHYWCSQGNHRNKRDTNTSNDYQKLRKILINELFREEIHNSVEKTFGFLRHDHKIEANCIRKGLKRLHIDNICVDIDECENSYGERMCDENAKCINTFGSYYCKCNDGYFGNGRLGNCFPKTYCSGIYCRLHGECEYRGGNEGYKCKCGLKCLNGGRCVTKRFSYACICPNNSTGLTCEHSADMYYLTRNFEDINNKKLLKNIIDTHNDAFDKFQLANLIDHFFMLNRKIK